MYHQQGPPLRRSWLPCLALLLMVAWSDQDSSSEKLREWREEKGLAVEGGMTVVLLSPDEEKTWSTWHDPEPPSGSSVDEILSIETTPHDEIEFTCAEGGCEEQGSIAIAWWLSCRASEASRCCAFLRLVEVNGVQVPQHSRLVCSGVEQHLIVRGLCGGGQPFSPLRIDGENTITIEIAGSDGAAKASEPASFFLRKSPSKAEDEEGHRAIVTGASSNHFLSLKNMIRSARETSGYRGKLVAFDLGLTDEQRAELESSGLAEVRRFPFGTFPRHVQYLYTYSWKPFIISEALQQFSTVLWMDAGNVFTFHGAHQAIFDKIACHGMFARRNTVMNDGTISSMTHPQTIEALQGQEVRYMPLCQAGFSGFLRGSAAYEAVVVPWRACALDQQCIAPRWSWLGNHRYDQSALSILMYRAGFRLWNHSQVPEVLTNQDLDPEDPESDHHKRVYLL